MSFLEDLKMNKFNDYVDIKDFNNALKEDFYFVINKLILNPDVYCLNVDDSYDLDYTYRKELEDILEENDVFEVPEVASIIVNTNFYLARVIKRKTGNIYGLMSNVNKIVDSKQVLELFSIIEEKDGRIDKQFAEIFCGKILNTVSNYNNDTYEDIKKMIVNYGVSNAFIPFDCLSNDIVNKLYSDGVISEVEFKGLMFIDNSKTTISEEEERNILDLFGYNNYSCLEDVIKEKKMDKVYGICDRLLLKVYVLKFLNNKGINDCRVTMFNLQQEDAAALTYGGEYIYVYNNPFSNEKFIEYVHRMHHESFHVEQSYDIKNCDVYKDCDILEYSKEKLLRFMIGDCYYNDNYYKITYELDADFKARLETNKLFGDNSDYSEFMSNERVLNNINASMHYIRDFKRDDIYLDEYFYESLNNFCFVDINNASLIKVIIDDNYPIINYEYSFKNNKYVRKSNKEIAKDFINSDKKDREIYRTIIKNRCDEFKYGKEVALNNMIMFNKLLKKDREKEDILNDIKNNKHIFLKYEDILIEILEMISIQEENKNKGNR